MRCNKKQSQGFTLIEILIVVILLGILAGLVLPQFLNTTYMAKKSSVQTVASSLRSQVALYRAQHNDRLPPLGGLWHAMTVATDATGTDYVSGASTGPFGPYMQEIPLNALTVSSVVIDAAVAPGSQTSTACGFEYDYNGGAGGGGVFGTDLDGRTVLP